MNDSKNVAPAPKTHTRESLRADARARFSLHGKNPVSGGSYSTEGGKLVLKQEPTGERECKCRPGAVIQESIVGEAAVVAVPMPAPPALAPAAVRAGDTGHNGE